MCLLDGVGKINPELSAHQIATLLGIAVEPGETLTRIAHRTGLGCGTVSRHIEVLGPHSAARGVGLGPIQADYDTKDRRQKVLTLCAKGRRVIESFATILQTKRGDAPAPIG